MSLVPAERRTLAKIAESLRASDPGLAHMLTHFAVPIGHGALTVFAHRHRSFRPMLVAVLTVAIMAVLTVIAMHGPSSVGPCGSKTASTSFVPLTTCQTGK